MNANGELGFKEKQNYFRFDVDLYFPSENKKNYFCNANADISRKKKKKSQLRIIFPYFYRAVFVLCKCIKSHHFNFTSFEFSDVI